MPRLQADNQSVRATESTLLEGRYTLGELPELRERVELLLDSRPSPLRLDGSAIEKLDTAGALILVHALRDRQQDPLEVFANSLSAEHRRILELVSDRLPRDWRKPDLPTGLVEVLERIGSSVVDILVEVRQLLGFLGVVVVGMLQTLVKPSRLRITSTVHHMEQAGLNAVPIVALLSFLIGAVLAFLGATVLQDFGAAVFTVELVTYAFLREFGVLLTAILLAGRSGSAFTAQIGSMKGREEIDAIRTLGLDPIELLVLPRLMALLVMLPVLTFIAMVMGLIGGMVVGVLSLDISTSMYITRVYETTELRHFWVGMVKAPVFALIIALIGCLEGMKVQGSAESVGRHTTSSVVQSIFMVILIDAIFAVAFMEMGW